MEKEESKHAVPELSNPDRGATKPKSKLSTAIWFCLLTTIFLCLSVSGGGALVLVVFFVPLAMFGLYFSYHLGTAIVETSSSLISKKKIGAVFLKMLGVQALIVVVSLLVIDLWYRFPVSGDCFDVCSPPLSFGDILMRFLAISTIASLPAYYAISKNIEQYPSPPPSSTKTEK